MGQFPTTNDKTKEVKNRALLDATAGALAGAMARFVVGPLDVLKIRFQVQLEPIARKQGANTTSQLSMGSKYTGMRQALVTIIREEGVQASLHSSTQGASKIRLHNSGSHRSCCHACQIFIMGSEMVMWECFVCRASGEALCRGSC